MKQSEKNYKRIVVKIGSSLFYSGKQLDTLHLFEIISHISSLIKNEKKEIVIVSSGAIALGMNLMRLSNRPKDLPSLQAAAAIGQNALMDNYSTQLKRHGITCAQILLTWDDFGERKRYLNAKNTILTLLKLGHVPIINENDTISTEEIRFGDNDRLSALVATMISADLLIILSDVDGLQDKDKNIIPLVDKITPQIKALACPTDKKTCVGGMVTKIEAAKIAVDSGISCVIANGRKSMIIHSVVQNPEKFGTLFVPKERLTERERWIAFGTKPKGKIVVDEGAEKAILANKSLLSVGIVSVEGNFSPKDIVLITNRKGIWIAKGSTTASSVKIQEVKGKRYNKEIIHCNNIVVL